MIEQLKGWSPQDVDAVLPLAKESLDTVTALTEYQDGKAGRIITGIALLSAAAGAVYAGMLKEVVSASTPLDIILFSCGFFVYAVFDAIGVFLLVRAISPWFHIPPHFRRQKNQPEGPPKSMVFGPAIAEASPEDWANAFKKDSTLLKIEYVKNYIHETYLVAEKVLRKYRRLSWAVCFVSVANALLLPLWLGYCLYLNMKMVMRKPRTCTSAEVMQFVPDSSNYSCFIVLDADNTLWDTDRLFAEAQTAMLNNICSYMGIAPKLDNTLKFVREIDQSIAASHPAGLKYPPELLASRLIKAVLKISGRSEKSLKNKRILMKKLAVAYLSKIREVPKLRTGVQEGLRNLRKLRARAVVCSEGVNESLLRNLNELGVLGYIEKVVVTPKSPEVFKSLADKFNPNRKLQLCVGDQLDRDIRNAKRAGYKTVYFPGNFRPNWLPGVETIKPDVTIDSLALLPGKVRVLKQKGTRRLASRAQVANHQVPTVG